MAHTVLTRLIRNFAGRGKAGKILFAGARTKLVPIAVLSEPSIRNLLVGIAAELGRKEQIQRQKAGRPFLKKGQDIIQDAAALLPETFFSVLAEAVNVLDAATDKASSGAISDVIDIPEEAIQAAFRTLAAIARALRTGKEK